MALSSLYRATHTCNQHGTFQANQEKLFQRLLDAFLGTWDLGFTAFGGPPVHFQIIHQRFVEGKGGRLKWIDEQTYQELFAICQALPGPGSTKHLFCTTLIHAGFIPALFVFFIWSLPGAIGMFALSLGVQRINEALPNPVYALLSGLNASTVGIIALAAVQLAEKAIKDRLTRILVIGGACAGLCYNALWYFPVLLAVGGVATVMWDIWLRSRVGKFRAELARRRRKDAVVEPDENALAEPLELQSQPSSHGKDVLTRTGEAVQRRVNVAPSGQRTASDSTAIHQANGDRLNTTQERDVPEDSEVAPAVDTLAHAIPVKLGLLIIAVFFATFIAVLVTRGAIKLRPLVLDVFASMYLAGTIIFGGGPVVIPLLREYVVQPGWVSSRDFLLGLAIIQAFPGPNFNFAVYLGALSLQRSEWPTILGAVLGYVGIFLPGISLAVGVQSLWRVLRTKPAVVSLLRGINATAVGLVFTAVYRLWEIGYLTRGESNGQSLAKEPWWVAVAALTYSGNAWFRIPAPIAILSGAVLGLCWYGAVGRFQ